MRNWFLTVRGNAGDDPGARTEPRTYSACRPPRIVSSINNEWAGLRPPCHVVAAAMTLMQLVACHPRESSRAPPPTDVSVTMGASRAAEQCAEAARVWFLKTYGSGTQPVPDGLVKARYSVLGGKPAGKCTILVSGTLTTLGPRSEPSSSVRWKSLVDVYADREVGAYFRSLERGAVDECQVSGESCQSEIEWEDLARAFAERSSEDDQR